MNGFSAELADCRLCDTRFAATASGHRPRPVVWFSADARILIASQAPGMKAHLAGVPFQDPSGVRLRNWLGLDEDAFYDRERIAIAPMAFCFPGYDAKGSDLPPPPICARTWRDRVMAHLPNIRLTLVIGGHAMRYHMDRVRSVTEAVAGWKDHPNDLFALPHPSWRNTAWLKRHPWFEAEVLPRLRARVKEVMND